MKPTKPASPTGPIILPVDAEGRVSFYDIPLFPHGGDSYTVFFGQLEDFVARAVAHGLDLDPDFQRGHVWTEAQQVRFVEYLLRGGEVGMNLIFNCPGHSGTTARGPYVIVDGKQRLEAVRKFLRDELRVFGHLRSEFRDTPRMQQSRFQWVIVEIDTRLELLQFYRDLNAGGTPHAPEEITRVDEMIAAERANPTPPWRKVA
jgi:hypothetical protein